MLPTTTRIRRRTAAAASAVALCALLVTACSDEPTAGGSKDRALTGNAQAQDADRAVKHRACLRAHGLDIQDPKPGEEGGLAIAGGDPKDFEAAAKACRSTAGGVGGTGEMSQADKDALVRYSQCMRKNGVDMPDPEPGQAMPAQKLTKKFTEAQAICQKELPQQGGAGQSEQGDTGK